ncbi:hypothetical protein N7509_007466 [Penicillium cosmopolitanum]|uniref:Clr5 domain-containing protein n=1 Tax=Penicillium cosmopolitanum TaxID=1131564 RepID=A0A9W9VZ62_9EURO|nr:uncharacterized protein N7509_007466 [Penicillium cosmopolitanum]KAJ5391976.1 hypothetical protein N7509_007466 [Penicillium cosmopolitanum]
MTRLSQENVIRYIKRWIKESRDEKKTASIVSYLSVGSLSLNEESTWTKIREELEDLGLDHEAFEKNRGFIHEELESAIMNGDLYGMYDSGSQGQKSSSLSSDTKTSHTSPPSTAESLIEKATPSTASFQGYPRPRIPIRPQRSTFSRLVYRVTHSTNSLADAVERGDSYSVKDLIRQGANINSQDKYGRRPAWFVCAVNGHIDILRTFVNNGANIVASGHGFHALETAAKYGHYGIVQLLLDVGVPVAREIDNSMRPSGPLVSAIHSNQEHVVKVLLENGADVNVVPVNGRTMLMIAAGRGCAKIAHLLLQYGAEIDKLDDEELTALDIACMNCRDKVVKLLLNAGAKADTSGLHSNTPLHWALIHEPKDENGDKGQLETTRLLLESDAKNELVKLLLQNGADVNKRTEGGLRPIILAAGTDDVSLVEIVLEEGSNPNEQDADGETALHKAIKSKNIAMTKLLLGKGANITTGKAANSSLLLAADTNDPTLVSLILDKDPSLEEADSNGETALWKAVRLKNLSMVKILLEKEANPNPTIKGGTMLHEAVESGDMAMIALLLHNGADPNIITKTGKFALMQAVASNKGHIVKLLLDNGAKPDLHPKVGRVNTALGRAVRDNNYSLVKLLLQRNAQIDLHAPEFDSALISACRLGYLQMVDVLLEHGANVNQKEDDGVSALSVITSGELLDNPQSVPITAILLEKGADPNTKSSRGLPVIFNLVQKGYPSRGKFAPYILKLLLAGGADPNSKTDDGTSLLQAIVKVGHFSLAEPVIERGVDLNPKGDDGYTNLMHAIERGDRQLLRLFLDKGAILDADTQSKHFFRIYNGRGYSVTLDMDTCLAAYGIFIKWGATGYDRPKYDWEPYGIA